MREHPTLVGSDLRATGSGKRNAEKNYDGLPVHSNASASEYSGVPADGDTARLSAEREAVIMGEMGRRVVSVRSWAGVVFVVGAGVIACETDYQKGLDDPTYKWPQQTFSGPAATATSTATSTTDSGPPPATAGAACVAAGGTLMSATSCTKHFADVLLAFKTAGCDNAVGCHGGTQAPHFDTSDSAGTWSTFASFKLSTGQLYLDPCSTDSSKSGILCNLSGTSCGTKMPYNLPSYPDTGLADLKTWLECGSPHD
jgi:hypothetical protein